MKKILITGACGFIGSHLTEMMIKKGYNVIAFDRYNSNNDYGWLNNSKYKKDIEFQLGDIRDFDSVYKVMKKVKTVFHLAALIGIPYSYISPLAYIKTNVEGTYNVLESSKILNLENVVITSTSETYGSAMYTPMDEEHRLFGQSPYAASKISADQVSLSYYNSFDTPIKLVRPFNVYGPRQDPTNPYSGVISKFIDNILKGNSVTINGGFQTRDFIFVQDVVNVMVKSMELLHEKNICKNFNVGTGRSVTIDELFSLTKSILNVEPEVIRKNLPYGDPERSAGTYTKIKEILGVDISSFIDLQSGLIKTIEYFSDKNVADSIK